MLHLRYHDWSWLLMLRGTCQSEDLKAHLTYYQFLDFIVQTGIFKSLVTGDLKVYFESDLYEHLILFPGLLFFLEYIGNSKYDSVGI